MNRKTLAIFLSLAMILSLLAANGLAFAEDAHPEAPAEEPQIVEVEEKTEESEAVEETVVTEPEEKEEVTEEPAETVTEPEEKEVETEKVEEEVTEEPEVTEDPKEEVETPEEEPENPEESEQPGKETGNTEGSETEGPTDPIEGKPEGANPDGSPIGGNNSPFEPPVIVVPESPVCSCGVNEGEAHEEGCPMYEAPAQPAPVVPAVPVEGCTCGTVSEDPQDHDVDCPVFLATINRLPAMPLVSLYERAMACETYEELMTVFGTASDEEVAALTEAEFNEIRNFAESMRPVPVIETVEIIEPEGEIFESEIDAYGESFTNAAPFVDNK